MHERLIPEGLYRAVVIAVDPPGDEFFETQHGTEYKDIKFKILEEGEYEGDVVWWRPYFSEKALPFTMRALEACGCSDPAEDIERGIKSNTVRIKVEHNEWNDKVTCRVGRVLPENSGKKSTKSGGASSRIKAYLEAHKPNKPKRDDLPF